MIVWIWNRGVTPTKEVSRFIEFLSRDFSLRRNDIQGSGFGIWNLFIWNLLY